MLSTGNAAPQICVSNLLQMRKKEAFYGRRKGVSTAEIDLPYSTAEDQITSDAEEMLEKNEQRVIVNGVYFTLDEDGEDPILMADIDLNVEDYMSESEDSDYE